MNENEKKIEELERQIDELLTEKYLDQQHNRRQELIKNELELLVRSLYRDSKVFLKEENEPIDARQMLTNLTQAIEQFSRDYNWSLGDG